VPTVKIYNTSRTDHRRRTVTEHKTGTREERLAARLKLLAAGKALTRRSDEPARRRQQLPWVRMDEEYVFDTDEGERSRDLFAGRSQLLVYHFMFGAHGPRDAPTARCTRNVSTAPSSISISAT
jgi:predicted dithiol-disulfide oxidoreductase (DUF899 family)